VLIQTVTFVLRPATSYRALELGVASAWLGALSASFAVVPLFVAVFVGRLTDRRGERPVLLAGAGLVVLAATGFALFGRSVAALVVWSALLGLGHLLSMVGGQSLAAGLAPSDRHDAAFGHYTFAASVGQALGPGLIAVLGGDAAAPDTARVFAGGVAVAAVFFGCAVLLRGRHTAAAERHGADAGGIRTVLGVPGLRRAILASLTVLAAVDLLVVYLPALGAEQGLSARVVGVLLALRAAASMASRFFLGTLAGRLGRERLLVGSIAGSAVAVAALAVPMPVAALGLAVVVAGLGLGVGQPLTMAWVVQAAPPTVRATALALRLTGNRFGQTVVPATVGLAAAAAGVSGVLWATAATLGVVAVITTERWGRMPG
jgi:MFS family permease